MTRFPARRDRLWLWFLALGAVVAALDGAGGLPRVAVPVTGGACVLAWAFGPRRHDLRPRRPWRLLTAAGAFFVVGVVMRGLLAGQPPPLAQLDDLYSLCGFGFFVAALLTFLNRWGADRHAVLDGSIVCLGAGVASVLLFVLPAAVPGRPLAAGVFAGLYPILDTVLLVLVANLACTTAVRQPAFRLLAASLALIFVGDVGYAVAARPGPGPGPPLLELPFVLAFALGGAAVLHPSARTLGRAVPLPVPAWSPRRLLVLGPAVAAPFLLTVFPAHESRPARWILGLGGAAIVALLLVRASGAAGGPAAAQRRREHRAVHDPRTGLPNRRLLVIMIERLLAQSGSDVWLFHLDLDGYRLVNDSWGHPVGDRLIAGVGARLRQALPGAATVAHLGADEFAIVQRCTEPDAMAAARRTMACIERPLLVVTAEGGTAEVVVGASMGVARAVSPSGAPAGSGRSADALLRDADTAMYRAKEPGRNRWAVYDHSMRDAVRERVEIEAALRAAVAHEQLSLAYQPVVELTSGRPAGAEALLRWQHPVRGWLGPNMFLAVADDANLLSALGAWVLREAVGQLAAWRAAGVVGPDFWMAVDVSPRQLADPAFTERLAGTLERAAVPPAGLVLEVTESVLVEGGEDTERVLAELRALGVRSSVDDFGTGFSALGYLRRRPVTGVTIDRSIVSGLGDGTDGAEDEETVRAVVAMSGALRLSVVAAGVETLAQRDALVTLGVTLAQGPLWGRAVPPDRFVATWLLSPAVSERFQKRVGEPVAARSD